MHSRFLLLVILIPSGPLVAQSRDLSGTWVLNLSKSSFGTLPAPMTDSMVVTQSGRLYHVDQYTTSAQGPTHMSSVWPVGDGEVTDTVPPQNGQPGAMMHSTIRMHGDTATFSGEILVEGQKVATQTGRQYLLSDKKSLTREVDLLLMVGAGAPMHFTAVYDRK